MNNSPVVYCRDVYKSYYDGPLVVDVLKGFDLSINAGERIAIIGPSGSGKSTLLHLLGGLDKPTKGHIFLQDIEWHVLSEKKRCLLRNKSLGFVYQFHHLLPEFSALENVMMPLLFAGTTVGTAEKQSMLILETIGLRARLNHKPAQLSGGERQRVAIARALVHRPQCVFADEPTGNLDQSTAMAVFEYMLALNAEFNSALVIVTHDKALASRMDRVLTLQEGRLVDS